MGIGNLFKSVLSAGKASLKSVGGWKGVVKGSKFSVKEAMASPGAQEVLKAGKWNWAKSAWQMAGKNADAAAATKFFGSDTTKEAFQMARKGITRAGIGAAAGFVEAKVEGRDTAGTLARMGLGAGIGYISANRPLNKVVSGMATRAKRLARMGGKTGKAHDLAAIKNAQSVPEATAAMEKGLENAFNRMPEAEKQALINNVAKTRAEVAAASTGGQSMSEFKAAKEAKAGQLPGAGTVNEVPKASNPVKEIEVPNQS